MSAARCASCSMEVGGARCNHCGAAVRAGRYEMLEVLAASIHGRTYRARGPDGPVALKELVFALVPTVQQLEAFEREARVLASLSHPNVPRFFESFREGQGAALRLYLAQELVVGEPLSTRLADSPFNEPEARDLADEVLCTLGYLHGRGIVHRDVKPANLVRRPDGSVALVDYGAARTVQDVTHGATLVGTYGYMPPEQLGGTVDASADLYSLGATLVHLLGQVSPADLLGPVLELRLDHLRVSPPFRRFLARLTAPRLKRIGSALAALQELQGSAPPGPRRNRAARVLAVCGLGMISLVSYCVVFQGGGQISPEHIEQAQRGRALWAFRAADETPSPSSPPEHVDIQIGQPLRGDRLAQLHADEPQCFREAGFDLSLVRVIRREHRLRFMSTIYSDQVWCSSMAFLVKARSASGELARIGGTAGSQRDNWRNRYDDFALPDSVKEVRFEISTPKGPVEAWRVNLESHGAHRVGWAVAGVVPLSPHAQPAREGCIERQPRLLKDLWIEFEALPLTLMATMELEHLPPGQLGCPGSFGLRYLGPREHAGETVAPQGEDELRLSVALPGVSTNARVALESDHRIASFRIDLQQGTAEREGDLVGTP